MKIYLLIATVIALRPSFGRQWSSMYQQVPHKHEKNLDKPTKVRKRPLVYYQYQSSNLGTKYQHHSPCQVRYQEWVLILSNKDYTKIISSDIEWKASPEILKKSNYMWQIIYLVSVLKVVWLWLIVVFASIICSCINHHSRVVIRTKFLNFRSVFLITLSEDFVIRLKGLVDDNVLIQENSSSIKRIFENEDGTSRRIIMVQFRCFFQMVSS